MEWKFADKHLKEIYNTYGEKEAALLIGKVYEKRAKELKLPRQNSLKRPP